MPSETINYLELPCANIAKTKTFFSDCFNWQFTDYGEEYTAFDAQGFTGGFYKSINCSTQATGGCLVVLLSDNLEESLAKVKANNGIIIQEIFDFPGGRRFHFTEPSGNEFAVWSEI